MDALATSSQPVDILIVGAGISGIGMAAHLARKCPGKSYAIVERRERLGGTWDLFRYPGIRSDSDMYTLGYEFEPWRDDRSIAGAGEILAYLGRVADRYGVRDHIRFGHKAICADWNSRAGLWTLELEDCDGNATALSGRFLFFGSGATAATLVPALAEKAAQVTMLQRTPSWYFSRPARDRFGNVLRRILPARAAYALTRLRNIRLQSYLFQQSRANPEGVKEFLHKQLEREMPGGYDRSDFSPPYGPWEQRLCMVPDGDLFTAINAGKAGIVTGKIETVDQTGVRLEDGSHIDADIIVAATGLKIATLGKIAVSLDGKPVDFSQTFYYRNCMFSNVPNLAALFGYLSAAWTLRVDMVANWLCRLFDQMDAWDVDVVTPYLAEDHGLAEENPVGLLSSGYLRRARHLIPKSSPTPPWRLSMDYLSDRKEMRDAPIDDGVLKFERAGVVAPAR